MDTRTLIAELDAAPSVTEFVSRRLFAGTPWIFRNNPGGYPRWRQECAIEARVQPDSLFIVGSAATGFSLAPRKAGRPFRKVSRSGPASDIDLAIVDNQLFTDSWDLLVAHDRGRNLIKTLGSSMGIPVEPSSTLAPVRAGIYWGWASHAHLFIGTEPSRRVRSVLMVTGRQQPFIGHEASARVYRRYDDLLDYHVYSARKLRRFLEDPQGTI